MDRLTIDPTVCARLFADIRTFSQDTPRVTRAAYGAGHLVLTMAGRDPARIGGFVEKLGV